MNENFDEDSEESLPPELREWEETKIPWTDFQEKEIHALLKIHFECLGYKVRWRHENDPSHEKGVDLECDNNSETILIGVKRKPMQKDISQLELLHQQDADRKIYLYTKGATQSFLETADEKPEVELWTTKDLEREFKRSNLIYNLYVGNSPFRESVRNIRTKLYNGVIDSDGEYEEITKNEVKELLPLVWKMKDRAVTLSKGARMLQLIYEQSNKLDSLSHDDLLFFLKRSLDFLDQRGLDALLNILTKNREKLMNVLNEVYQDTMGRSNWDYIFRISFSNMIPGRVMDELKPTEGKPENAEKLESIREKVEGEKNLNHNFRRPNRFRITSDIFRRVANFAWGLEATIDDIYDTLLNKL